MSYNEKKRLRIGCKHSCDDRVVKVLDLKSNGVSPRRFEPCSQRNEPVLTFKTSRDIHFSADLENHWPSSVCCSVFAVK